MRERPQKRLLSVVLLIAMLASLLVVPAGAAPADKAGTVSLEFEEIQVSGDELDGLYQNTADCGSTAGQDSDLAEEFDAEDIVRVSVVLESPSAMAVGYTVDELTTDNSAAERYREELLSMQEGLTEYLLEEEIVSTLEIKRNLTMAANMLSAEVKYGEIENIEAVEGVLEVIVETCYLPAVYDTQESYSAEMATSNIQTGSTTAYDLNWTGAGSRIAIIDTGLDLDHQSFDHGAFQYSLEESARKKLNEQGNADPTDEEIQAYIDGLDLLDEAEIESLRDKLNISRKVSTDSLFYTDKVAFGYNYVDGNTYITHDFDSQGEHGSHVSGIAAANRYVAENGGYESALDSVKLQGVAFDAQILVMKVFGRTGGAYDSDIVAAIEDALILGADVINVSLGTTVAGFSVNSSAEYQTVYDSLMDSGAVLSISAGNSGYFFSDALNGGRLYADDVNFDRVGSPGTMSSSVAVASVDNAGSVHLTFEAGEESFPYYTVKNKAGDAKQLYDLKAGEYEYIFLTGYGYDAEEYTAIGGKDVVEGKIVFASRGGNALTALTARPLMAAQYGAAACVVYNDRGGVAVLSFGSAECSIPSATTSKQAASRLLALSTPVYSNGTSEPSDDNDKPLYYTGTLTITADKTLVATEEAIDPQYSEISYFSSWGVPGSLELKPEISAPGGGIYSVDGSVTGGEAYEIMSGTSMAAPQISGMAAVVAQYIRESALEEDTGLTVRQLAQSLLMSTATPLKAAERTYTSVLAQGAGLANVGAAVSAESYILMGANATDFYADGKVKAELGDDPDRDGEYTFSFTINSLTDEDIAYELSADLFTQSVYTENGILYQDTSTAPLAAQVSFLIDGEEYAPVSSVKCDLNGDGVTDAKDAQIILNHTVGIATVIDDSAAKKVLADVDGDGAVTTYDAHLILSELTTRAVQIPAGESVTVRVTITFPETLKSYLDELYPNGAYIEGFVRVTPVAYPDGGEAVYAHSIPILGYYGSWTDPSMFDRTTMIGQTYANVEEPDSYAKNSAAGLRYSPSYGSKEIWYLGNPFMSMEEYPAGKEAISEDAVLQSYVFTPMRNMAALMGFIKNETTGEYVYTGTVYQYTYAGYGGYTTSGTKAWAYQDLSVDLGQKLSTLSGISEDDMLTVGLVAVPEYYGYPTTAAEMVALMESGALGDGAYLTTTFALDNTAPELLNATASTETSLTGGETKKTLDLTIQDNQYAAYIALTSGDGLTVYGEQLPEQTTAGEQVTVSFDVSDVDLDKSYRVLLGDYAGNLRAYRFIGESSSEDTGGLYLFGFSGNDSTSRKVDLANLSYDGKTPAGVTVGDVMPVKIAAAEYARGYVFMLGTDNCLYAAEPDDLSGSMTKVCQYETSTNNTVKFRDLTYDSTSGIMYALDCHEIKSGSSYSHDEVNIIYTIDLETGEATEAFRVSIVYPDRTNNKTSKELTAFATDGKGTFYGVNSSLTASMNSYLYTWTLDEVEKNDNAITDLYPMDYDAETKTATATGFISYIANASAMPPHGSMTWSKDGDCLLWLTSYVSSGTKYSRVVKFAVDQTTGGISPKAELINDKGDTIAGCIEGKSQASGLYYVPVEETDPITETDTAYQVVLSSTELGLMIGDSTQLTAEVFPWNLTDKSITWSSTDTDVAIVNQNGVVTAVGAGETTITVTTTARDKDDQPCTAKCTVTVQNVPEIGFSALIEDANGTYWAESGLNSLNFSTADLTGNEQESRDLSLGAQTGNTFLFRDEDADFVILDADSGDVLEETRNWLSGNGAWDCITGLPVIENTRNWKSSSYKWNDEGAPDEAFGVYLAAYRYDSKQYVALITQDGQKIADSVFRTFNNDPIVAIAAGETGPKGTNYPSVRVYILSESGKLYYADAYSTCSLKNGQYSVGYLGHTSAKSINANCVATAEGSTNTMFYDAETGKLLLFSSSQSGATALYTIDAATGSYTVNGTRNGSAVQAVYRYEKLGESQAVIRGLDTSAKIYTGKTVQLYAKTAPAVGGTTAVTWSSSDETIATVDQNGVVTGVYDDGGKGTSEAVTITATAVGNESVKADCKVTVTATKKLAEDVEITALVSDRSGNAYWSEFTANDLDTVVKKVKSSANLAAAGWSADGYLYGLVGASSYRELYRIDPKTYELAEDHTTEYGIVRSGKDITFAPAKTIRTSDGETLELFGGIMVEQGPLMTHLSTEAYPDVTGGNLKTHNDYPDKAGDRKGVIYLGAGDETEEGFPTLRYLTYSYNYAQIVTVTPTVVDGEIVCYEERTPLFYYELPNTGNTKHIEGIYISGTGLILAAQNATDGEVDFWLIELDVDTWESGDDTPTPQYMGSLTGVSDIVGMFTDEDVKLNREDTTIYEVEYSLSASGADGDNENSAEQPANGEDGAGSTSDVGPAAEDQNEVIEDAGDDPVEDASAGDDPVAEPEPDEEDAISDDGSVPTDAEPGADAGNGDEDQQDDEREPADVEAEFPASALTGTTMAVASGQQARVVSVSKYSSVAAQDGVVTLTLVSQSSAANALFAVSYDPHVLTYSGMTTSSELNAVSVDTAKGEITVASASAFAIPAGDILSTLTFTYSSRWISTALTVDTAERGDALGLTEDIRVFRVEVTPDYTDNTTGGSGSGGTTGAGKKDNDDNVINDDGGLQIRPCVNGHSGMVAVQITEDGQRIILKSYYDSETQALVYDWDGTGEVIIENNEKSFSDTAGHWAEDAITFVTSRELFNGTGDGLFAPDSGMTRAMLVTVLHRLENETTADSNAAFSDVANDAWYTDAVYWAQSNGIVDGYGNGLFGAQDNIDREQMVVMLYRYAQYLGTDTSMKGSLSGFGDGGEVSSWAQDAMAWAVENGIITGKPGDLLDPTGEVSRAEVAVMIQRMVSLMLR